MVKVYAPASSANMSVGFDVLGAAALIRKKSANWRIASALKCQ